MSNKIKVKVRVDFGETSDKLNDSEWEMLVNSSFIGRHGVIELEMDLADGSCTVDEIENKKERLWPNEDGYRKE